MFTVLVSELSKKGKSKGSHIPPPAYRIVLRSLVICDVRWFISASDCMPGKQRDRGRKETQSQRQSHRDHIETRGHRRMGHKEPDDSMILSTNIHMSPD